MIHALPGMGANGLMYPSAWDSISGLVRQQWPKYANETTLGQVAARLCTLYNIKDGDIIIGSSLGGMVACEIAKLRQLRQLYLLGSATSPSEINALLNFLHPLAAFAPIEALRFSAASIPVELAQMFSHAEPAFIQAMIKAIFAWEGLSQPPTKTFRLHGALDRVIRPPAQPDLLLKDGGHLISMTHAGPCINFIERHLLPTTAN